MSDKVDGPGVDLHVGPAPLRPRTWVLVQGGIAKKVKHTFDWFKHPFEDDLDNARVVDGTGVDVQPGYMVDDKGNFTPAEGRTAPIPQGLPAYHAGPGVTRLPGLLAAELSGSELSDNLKRPAEDQLTVPVSNKTGMATVKPSNKDVAEHDAPTEPVHTTGVVENEAHDANHGVVEHHEHYVGGETDVTHTENKPHEG